LIPIAPLLLALSSVPNGLFIRILKNIKNILIHFIDFSITDLNVDKSAGFLAAIENFGTSLDQGSPFQFLQSYFSMSKWFVTAQKSALIENL
jgi:hypothetical protein